MPTAAILAENLCKSYGEREVLRGVDLEVVEGEIVAFLGPNGAGKTTTIEILEGFRTPTSGSVRVLGQDPQHAPRSWKEDIGIVLQSSRPLRSLTVREVLRMQAAYYRKPREVASVLELVGLVEQADRRVGKLSGGQQRRVDLGLALIGDPRLIFLDEPTTGFDPTARRGAWDMIAGLRLLGCTVLLTTHYMDEAQHLADNIVVIGGGAIIARGTARELADRVRARTRISWTAPQPVGLDLAVTVIDGRFSVELDDEHEVTNVVHRLTGWAMESGMPLADFEVVRPSLESTYLSLVEGVGA